MTTKKLKRVESAKKRADVYNQLTTAQKILLINEKFGVGIGATKQRARLAQRLEDEKLNPVVKEEKTKKNYQKPKKS